MNISTKQLRLIVLLEKCGGMYRHELNETQYPESLIDALIDKELVSEDLSGLLISTTS